MQKGTRHYKIDMDKQIKVYGVRSELNATSTESKFIDIIQMPKVVPRQFHAHIEDDKN